MTRVYVPPDPPDRCPACGDAYESVSRHADGFVVALRENERYARVCFHPVDADAGGRDGDDRDANWGGDADDDRDASGDGHARLDCYHHTHADAGVRPD